MPWFTYTGPAARVTIKGRTFPRGIPTQVHEKIAAAIVEHADMSEADGPTADSATNEPPSPAATIEDIAAYLTGTDPQADELAAKLKLLDEATLRELGAEYRIEADDEAEALRELATKMLADDTPEPQPIGARQQVYDQALKDKILEQPKVAKSDDGVLSARIEDGKLIEELAEVTS